MTALLDARTLLNRLIIEGEAVLQLRHVDLGEASELLISVNTLRQRPTDRERLIDDHTVIYAQALMFAAKLLAAHQTATRYTLVVAVLIDFLRADFGRAIEQSRGGL